MAAFLIMKITCVTNSSDETIALGKLIGKKLAPGDMLALLGDLGAGKTTFTRGLAEGLGVDADVHSPTFVLIHEHYGNVPLYHVDLYRLDGAHEAENIGIDEYIYGNGVTVIEWADRMSPLLPPERIDIEFKLVGDTKREISFSTESDRLRDIIKEISVNACCSD